MDRYYLADVVEDPWGEGTLCAAVVYYPVDFSGSPSVDAQGKLLCNWALVLVTGGDQAPLLTDARIDPLPTCPLDTTVAQIDQDELAVLRAALTRRNIAVATSDTAMTYGEILAQITLRANINGIVPAIAKMSL